MAGIFYRLSYQGSPNRKTSQKERLEVTGIQRKGTLFFHYDYLTTEDGPPKSLRVLGLQTQILLHQQRYDIKGKKEML